MGLLSALLRQATDLGVEPGGTIGDSDIMWSIFAKLAQLPKGGAE